MSKFSFLRGSDAEIYERKVRERKVRERLNKQDQQFWRDLAAKCLKIAEINEPRKREMAAEAYFVDMHGTPPQHLTKYLQENRLPPVGDSERFPRASFRLKSFGTKAISQKTAKTGRPTSTK